MENKISSILVVTPSVNLIYTSDENIEITKKMDLYDMCGQKFMYSVYYKDEKRILNIPSCFNVLETVLLND